MFGLVLREDGEDRLVYSTSLWFRIVFAAMSILIILCLAVVPEGDFLSRLRPFPLALIAVCVLAALYLERWTFDRKANSLERNSGLLFLHTRKRTPLDSLRKVVLHSTGIVRAPKEARFLKWGARGAVMASLIDRDGKVYRLDMESANAAQSVRILAERVAGFCAIPLEEDGAASREADVE